jgi:hypothetical protein
MIYRFNVMLMKLLVVFCTETEEKRAIFRKEKVQGIIIPDLKIYYKVIVIKTVR